MTDSDVDARCREVRALLEDTITRVRKEHSDRFGDYQIFIAVFGNTDDMRTIFYVFLHDVATCPREVIAWCQARLNTRR